MGVILSRSVAYGLLITFALGAAAEPAKTPEQRLLELDDRQRQMILTGDGAGMRKLAHPNLHINAPANEVLDREEFLRRLDQHIIAFENHRRITEKVYITGDVGIVMGREEVLPTATSESGKLFGQRALMRRYTNVYIMEDGMWRFLARHANIVAR
jgi:Domain of unknown function (DUF4440)